MTITNPDRSAIGVVVTRRRGSGRRWWASTELARLHLASRRVPEAIAVFVACAVVFQALVRWYDTGPLAMQVPPIVEAAAACIVSVSARSPFGESEPRHGSLASLPSARSSGRAFGRSVCNARRRLCR